MQMSVEFPLLFFFLNVNFMLVMYQTGNDHLQLHFVSKLSTIRTMLCTGTP